MFRYIISPLLLIAPLCAQQIIPPANLFRDPKFVREFVGSYGFLSEVEPKVTTEEQAALTTIRELFDQSKFHEAEAELTRFIKETESPTDPEKAPAEISAAMGSTKPESCPQKKARPFEIPSLRKGIETAKPSGKF